MTESLPDLVDPIDGHSLADLIHAPDRDWLDEAMIEFTAEGTYAPCLILRQGRYKYVYCETDPGMLFDLESDPGELNNLSGDPVHAPVETHLRSEVLKRWDPVTLETDIIASQQRRLFLQPVLLTGQRSPWDYQPISDASKQFVRSSKDASTTLTGGARFPYVPPVPPDFPRES